MATEIEGIKFYTVPETAKALQVTPQTVRAYIKQGKLRSQRIGRPIFITERNLQEFLKPSLPAKAIRAEDYPGIQINYPHKGQLTLFYCMELIRELEKKEEPYHLYYKHQQKGEKYYATTKDLILAINSPYRYGSLFLRAGDTHNWYDQFQIVNNTTLEPI